MPYTMQMASNGVAVQLRRGQWRGALTNLDATIANGKTIRGAQRRQLQPFVELSPIGHSPHFQSHLFNFLTF